MAPIDLSRLEGHEICCRVAGQGLRPLHVSHGADCFGRDRDRDVRKRHPARPSLAREHHARQLRRLAGRCDEHADGACSGNRGSDRCENADRTARATCKSQACQHGPAEPPPAQRRQGMRHGFGPELRMNQARSASESPSGLGPGARLARLRLMKATGPIGFCSVLRRAVECAALTKPDRLMPVRNLRRAYGCRVVRSFTVQRLGATATCPSLSRCPISHNAGRMVRRTEARATISFGFDVGLLCQTSAPLDRGGLLGVIEPTVAGPGSIGCVHPARQTVTTIKQDRCRTRRRGVRHRM